jgi:hypothetical protein
MGGSKASPLEVKCPWVKHPLGRYTSSVLKSLTTYLWIPDPSHKHWQAGFGPPCCLNVPGGPNAAWSPTSGSHHPSNIPYWCLTLVRSSCDTSDDTRRSHHYSRWRRKRILSDSQINKKLLMPRSIKKRYCRPGLGQDGSIHSFSQCQAAETSLLFSGITYLPRPQPWAQHGPQPCRGPLHLPSP